MNRVISYSLWGDNPKYTFGAIRNAEIAKDIYPDWTCYFFVSKESVPINIIEELSSANNCKVILMKSKDSWANMFWRFSTSYHQDVDVSIFRDTDSRLSYREKYAVDNWLESGKTFHVMRDHPYHRFPILGGMWGYRKNNKYEMKNLLSNFHKTNEYGTDYKFFIEKLYPIIHEDKLVHDPFFENKPFPTKRINKEFVGDVFDENDVRHPEYWKLIP